MRISDWSSDVCSSDLACGYIALLAVEQEHEGRGVAKALVEQAELWAREMGFSRLALDVFASNDHALKFYDRAGFRSEEHTSELQSLMRISYAVFCLKKKKHKNQNRKNYYSNILKVIIIT